MALEINKRYEVEIVEADGSRSYIRGISEAVDGHLLTLAFDGKRKVFNTAASTFVGLEEWRELPEGSKYQPGKAPARMYLDDEPTV